MTQSLDLTPLQKAVNSLAFAVERTEREKSDDMLFYPMHSACSAPKTERTVKLSDHDMAIVRNILATITPECEVWAFGSRVHGKGLKKFSDIDLAVIAEAPIETALMAELSDAFAESDLPYRVDVVDYISASQTFRDIIRREHEVIQHD